MSAAAPAPAPTPTGAPGRVLFVSHEARRTGAPMLLLRWLRWARKHTTLDFEVLLLEGGELAEEFSDLAPVHHAGLDGPAKGGAADLLLEVVGAKRTTDRLRRRRARRAVTDLRGFDTLYLNSATSARAFDVLPEVPPFVVTHLHEASSALTYWFPESQRTAMLRRTDLYVTCADVVTRSLIGAFEADRHRIRRHHGFIEPFTIDRRSGLEARRQLGIADDAVVVGGVGSITWRKGVDLFVALAAEVMARRPEAEVHFVWAGAPDQWGDPLPYEADVAALGLSERVHFVGSFTDAAATYAAFDMFCLTSREDPFPLVVLEAASVGLPVLSFANGGVVELAAASGDPDRPLVEVVGYLDVAALAESVVRLADDRAARLELGRRVQQHVLAHHVTDVAAPALYDDLRGLVPGFC